MSERAPPPTLRARLWFVSKVGLTAGFVALALWRVNLRDVASALAGASVLGVAAAVLLTYASVVASAWRWKRVLARLGEHVPLREVIGDTLVGSTYNLFLPTSVGGDFIRAVRCAARVQSVERAWASAAFERVMGLLSLVLMSLVGLAFSSVAAARELVVAASALTVGLILALVLAPVPLRWLSKVERFGFRHLSDTLHKIAEAFSGPLATPAARLETLGWSLVYQVVALSILLPIALTWNESGLFAGIFLGVPIALVATTLPVTIGGHGLREAAFVFALQPFGIATEHALALSLVWLGSNLVVGLSGLVVLFAKGR